MSTAYPKDQGIAAFQPPSPTEPSPHDGVTVVVGVHSIHPNLRELDPTLNEAQVTVAITRLDQIWDEFFPAEQQHIVRLLVEKVIVSPQDIEVRLRQTGIEKLALELRPAVPEEVAA